MAGEPNWVELDGVVNMRDLGGMTTAAGRVIREGVVLRSDNLDDLTAGSVAHLLNGFGLSDVIDLRTNGERARAGAFPLGERVRLHTLSVYPEDDPDDPMPPWFGETDVLEAGEPNDTVHIVAGHYRGYFKSRPDSLVAALRAVQQAPGATIINCAAGKDRTGTVCAVLLGALGVPQEQIIADYAASTERIEAILGRLGVAASAGSAEHDAQVASQSTPPQIMEILLGKLDRDFGGIPGWLTANGWARADQAALEDKLLD